MIQVNQHEVVSAIGSSMVKSNRANVLGERMLQPLGTCCPTVLERWKTKNLGLAPSLNLISRRRFRDHAGRCLILSLIVDRLERRLLGQRQTDFDHLADVVRREPKLPLSLTILFE